MNHSSAPLQVTLDYSSLIRNICEFISSGLCPPGEEWTNPSCMVKMIKKPQI